MKPLISPLAALGDVGALNSPILPAVSGTARDDGQGSHARQQKSEHSVASSHVFVHEQGGALSKGQVSFEKSGVQCRLDAQPHEAGCHVSPDYPFCETGKLGTMFHKIWE